MKYISLQTNTVVYPRSLRIAFAASLLAITVCARPCLSEDAFPFVACSRTPSADDCNVEKINTRGRQDAPYITPDGLRLYFTYTPWSFYGMVTSQPHRTGPDRPGMTLLQANNPWGPSNTYMSMRLANGHWSSPVRVPWDHASGSCCMKPNKDETAFYFQRETGDPKRKNEIVYIKRQDDKSWSAPIAMPASINGQGSNENPYLSQDGKTLYWTSTRDGGFGGKDLWFSNLAPNGEWSPAQNMGPSINTGHEEDQIWISADKKTAYFNRDLTIMVSHFEKGEWQVAEPLVFDAPVGPIAQASLPDDGLSMYLVAIDMVKKNLIVSVSRRLPNGHWSAPKPID